MSEQVTAILERPTQSLLVALVLAACSSTHTTRPVGTSLGNSEVSSVAVADRILARSMELRYDQPLQSAPIIKARQRAFELYGSLCLGGDAAACLLASREPPWQISDEIDRRIARNCREGHALSCRSLIWHTDENETAPKLTSTQLREGCLAGLMTECSALSDAESTADVRFGTDRMCAYSRVTCEQAVESYLHETPRDPERARYLLELNCQLLDTAACQILIHAYRTGAITEPVPGRAAMVRAFLCKTFQDCRED